jgi:hypothetical protein
LSALRKTSPINTARGTTINSAKPPTSRYVTSLLVPVVRPEVAQGSVGKKREEGADRKRAGDDDDPQAAGQAFKHDATR